MLIEDRATLSSALFWRGAIDARRDMTRRYEAALDQAEAATGVLEIAPSLTRNVTRTLAATAIGLNIALSLIDVWRLLYINVAPEAVNAALVALAFAMPLHLRHVIYGLRGERPPAGAWTLALLVVINAVAFPNVGDGWIFQYASLAVSILIVVPGLWGIALASVVFASPVVLVGTQWYGGFYPYPGFYLAFAIIWRATTQFVPLRLLAAIRALDAAGRELEARAVVQARVRIDGELRTGVTGALQQIVARGEAARAVAERDSDAAVRELRVLVNDSRRTLTQARRVVAGYRGASLRAELDAAAALLEASGATVRIDADDGVLLDAPDDNARTAIRSAIAQALRDEPNAAYRLVATRTVTGTLNVAVLPDEPSGTSSPRSER